MPVLAVPNAMPPVRTGTRDETGPAGRPATGPTQRLPVALPAVPLMSRDEPFLCQYEERQQRHDLADFVDGTVGVARQPAEAAVHEATHGYRRGARNADYNRALRAEEQKRRCA